MSVLYDAGLFVAGIVVGAGGLVAVLWVLDVKELPESALDAADGERVDVAAVQAQWNATGGRIPAPHPVHYELAIEEADQRGYDRCAAEQKAKKRAAGLQAAATRKRRDTIIGGEG